MPAGAPAAPAAVPRAAPAAAVRATGAGVSSTDATGRSADAIVWEPVAKVSQVDVGSMREVLVRDGKKKVLLVRTDGGAFRATGHRCT